MRPATSFSTSPSKLFAERNNLPRRQKLVATDLTHSVATQEGQSSRPGWLLLNVRDLEVNLRAGWNNVSETLVQAEMDEI
jgi:hypothetical protein